MYQKIFSSIKIIFITIIINCGNLYASTFFTNIIVIKCNNNNIVNDSINKLNKIELKYLTGEFNPALDTNFVLVEFPYTNKKDIYIRKTVYQAFKKMADDAARDGIKLIIVSGTRNFEEQKLLWENKWTGKTEVNKKKLNIEIFDSVDKAMEILTYTAMPGTSRHHWGTDIDINSTDTSYFKSNTGRKVFDWLVKNASQYGFCMPYNYFNAKRPFGHEEEYWHWSYLPLAKVFLNNYLENVKNENIKGFLGAETVTEINVIEYYVKAINHECY
jgi:LAS superfamily LD-carboxypeptidase LdcB